MVHELVLMHRLTAKAIIIHVLQYKGESYTHVLQTLGVQKGKGDLARTMSCLSQLEKQIIL